MSLYKQKKKKKIGGKNGRQKEQRFRNHHLSRRATSLKKKKLMVSFNTCLNCLKTQQSYPSQSRDVVYVCPWLLGSASRCPNISPGFLMCVPCLRCVKAALPPLADQNGVTLTVVPLTLLFSHLGSQTQGVQSALVSHNLQFNGIFAVSSLQCLLIGPGPPILYFPEYTLL